MDFDFTEEQEMWRRTVNSFVDREISREYVRQCDQEHRYPKEIAEKLAENGWLGLILPEEYGGAGQDAMMLAIFSEAMARYLVEMANMFFAPMFHAMHVANWGTEEQKKQYLPPFIKGEINISLALTEPESGSDAASITTLAEADGDDFVINGQKQWASGAHHQNNIILTAVRTDRNVPKHEGISLLLVPNTTPGVETTVLPTIVRRSYGTCQVFFDHARVPKKNLLGGLNKGWDVLRSHFGMERAIVAVAAMGTAQTALNDTINYAKQRTQFGQPIGKFQEIKHALADLQTEVDAARLLAYRASWLISQGRPSPQKSSMAKLFAAEVFYRVTTWGMQIMGGYSVLPDMDMERYWRESKFVAVGGGTNQIQRFLIARDMGL